MSLFWSLEGLNLAAANGNAEAADFLWVWGAYLRRVDDVIDDARWNHEDVLAAIMYACTFYSHPFYVRHATMLQLPVLLATNMFQDSCEWEVQPDLWKRQWADVFRHAGNAMIHSVALICGGWDHLRKYSQPLNAMCYCYHKDKYGVPTDAKSVPFPG